MILKWDAEFDEIILILFYIHIFIMQGEQIVEYLRR